MIKSVRVFAFSLLLVILACLSLGQTPDQSVAEKRISAITSGLQRDSSKVRDAAKREKKSGRYGDTAKTKSTGWGARAMERVDKLLNFDAPDLKLDPPAGGPPSAATITVVQVLIWAIIGGGVLVGLYFALRNINWSKSKKRAIALIEDSEPDRTADEWLRLSDELSAKGEFRAALRALYVATLIRLDENRVLSFRKWETNWEHLSRFQQIPDSHGIDLRPITASFDRFWYGSAVAQMSDVTLFRESYTEVVRKLAERRTK